MQPEAPGPSEAPPPGGGRHPLLPSVREHLPSVAFGATLPVGAYFLVRGHLNTDTAALIVAGSISVAWILLQFVRQRRLDAVGGVVLLGFVVGVATSTMLGGNSYMLKVRDAFFTALFGVACIVTLFTHDRPALFYVGRYLSAGRDPDRLSAFDRIHELPSGRRTIRVLSVVWGVGLVVEASLRLALADVLTTGVFLAVSPFVTAGTLGALFGFSVLYVKRMQLESGYVVGAADPGPGGQGRSSGKSVEGGEGFPPRDPGH